MPPHGTAGRLGMSLVEAAAVLAVGALVLAASVPALAALRAGSRVAAGTREIATTLEALRWRSVASGRSHGLAFAVDERGWSWLVVEDGNGNGLRTSEVRSGTDRVVDGPHRLEDRVSAVRLGLPDRGSIPEIPPRTGAIADRLDPIQFGRSDLVSFSAGGTSSSGTIYVTDGRDLRAIVLYGATARVRVWRYEARSGTWSL